MIWSIVLQVKYNLQRKILYGCQTFKLMKPENMDENKFE